MKNLTMSVFLIMASGCEDSNQLPDRDYQLVWSDEFRGITGDAPDTTNWTFDIGTGENGWGNEELQYYTSRPENVSIDGKGNLVITAIEESFEGSNYTSARIKTKGLREQTYGRFEARIKTPFGQGLWPAFWLLGADIDEVGWPQTGEIDVMELRGQEPDVISGAIHGPGYSADDAITENFYLFGERFDTAFHVFAIEWGPNFIDFFVDDRLYQRLSPDDLPEESDWVFDKDFFILLNVAVGGTFVGFPSNNTRFPQTMIVDYVRVYN
ncbi:MAG: glycoside hydrolase family 16 protein [Bacteroidota bacterium]